MARIKQDPNYRVSSMFTNYLFVMLVVMLVVWSVVETELWE